MDTTFRTHPILHLLLLILTVGVVYAILTTPSLLEKDFISLAKKEEQITAAMGSRLEQELSARALTLETELAAINPETLRLAAVEQYESELKGRKTYEARFALSPREKAQLHMQALASDSTRSFHDAIIAVAREASPEGSDIELKKSSQGLALHIDFDMSVMTSGEDGTRTKHNTKDSLRKEVIFLISRATNDILLFCKDFELASIHVGCRHYVEMVDGAGYSMNENRLLYKAKIRKKRVKEMTSNPFLDIYSTEQYLELDEDNFENIEIVTVQS